ncbi:occlusion derived envelope protein [Choristoneura fumiferana multiple nucleopolyhedrovirus]|uniref:Occlusion derived envelope protein n=1 Tax=Choristoneura fumiferana nuclear polyhedrosis virus TaxID=208973 RepID=Q7TLR1_NPVCF|nr:occlusion derived envelope protein [Choristoneura fumiferana multiple nucleopolyhedrovirus]AAP29868.1 occlusion derived envelope protein [Choristoneura fumiferana multiple nucleopolyhedrovirus]
MWGALLLLILLAFLFYLWYNGKLNLNSLNESSPSLNQSSDSVQVDPQTEQLNVKLNNNKLTYMRVAHGDNKVSQVYVAEKPMSMDDIEKQGTARVGANSVFIGTIYDQGVRSPNAPSASNEVTVTRTTANFDVKEYKNMFIVVKGLSPGKMTKEDNMLCFTVDGLHVCLIDANAAPLSERDMRELRRSACTLVYTRNSAAQQLLLESGYTVVNAEHTAYLKNQKSYREL